MRTFGRIISQYSIYLFIGAYLLFVEKDSLTCYTSTACNADSADLVVVQSLPMLVSLPASNNMTR